MQSPGSRRSVAPCRLGAPPAASISPALPRGRRHPSGPGSAPPFRPSGFPRPSAPKGLPPCLRGRPDDRCAATGPPLRHFGTFLLPGPGRLRCVRTAGPRVLRPAPLPHKPADAPLGRFCLVLRAVGRQALRADCLGPPAFSNLCPLPERPRFVRTRPVRGLMRSRLRDRIKTRPLRPPALWLPACRLSPPKVGDSRPRAISFFPRRGDTCVTPLLAGRRDSPAVLLRTRHGSLVRALALETADADSRAPDGPSLRSGPPGRALGKPKSKDETRAHRRVALIGKGNGGRFSMQATGIGVPPLSPLPAFPHRLGDALKRGRRGNISTRGRKMSPWRVYILLTLNSLSLKCHSMKYPMAMKSGSDTTVLARVNRMPR